MKKVICCGWVWKNPCRMGRHTGTIRAREIVRWIERDRELEYAKMTCIERWKWRLLLDHFHEPFPLGSCKEQVS